MDFKQEKYFMDAVNSGDIQEIKIAICLYIDKDPADYRGDIKKAINYLDSKGIDIWQEHKEIEPLKSKDQWDRDYIGLLQSDLMHNFSRERLNNILKVGKYVYERSNTIKSNKTSYKNSTLTKKELSNKCSVNKEKKNLQKNIKTSTSNQAFNNDYDAYFDQRSNEMNVDYSEKKEALNKKKSNISIVSKNNKKNILDEAIKFFGKICRKSKK